MNKNELIAKVAKDAKLTKGEAGEAIEATIENIMRALQGRRRCAPRRLRHLHGDTPQGQPRRAIRRPARPIKLPARKRAKFKAGKVLEGGRERLDTSFRRLRYISPACPSVHAGFL